MGWVIRGECFRVKGYVSAAFDEFRHLVCSRSVDRDDFFFMLSFGGQDS
jgi:hypothetical protein